MAKIKKGDLVQVISGARDERGKQGKVLDVIVERNRVIVEGVNYVTKHTRVGQTQRGTKTGGIETVEASIHISNVALVDPKTNQPARVGTALVGGKKERVFKPSRRLAKPAKAEPAKSTKKKAAADESAEPAEES